MSGWDGRTVTTLAEDRSIAAASVHRYSITVVANVSELEDLADVRCGFANEAVLGFGAASMEADACGPIPVGRIRLVKAVDNSAFEGARAADPPAHAAGRLGAHGRGRGDDRRGGWR